MRGHARAAPASLALRASEIGPTDLEALEAKYAFMVEVHAAHATGRVLPPRAAFRAIGREFPGALKELERLPRALLVARLGDVRAASAGGAIPRWIRTVHGYHRALAWCLDSIAARRSPEGIAQARPVPETIARAIDEQLALRPRPRLEDIAVRIVGEGSGLDASEVARELGFVSTGLRSGLRRPAD